MMTGMSRILRLLLVWTIQLQLTVCWYIVIITRHQHYLHITSRPAIANVHMPGVSRLSRLLVTVENRILQCLY